MYVLLAILNDIFKTALDSLKRDLGEAGFEMILILALLGWAGIFIIIWLLARGQFQMPTDPMFYLFWFGLTLLTEISFTLFLLGLVNTSFFTASSLENMTFIITAIYAAIFLGEKYTALQIGAIAVAAIGALLFFKKGFSKKYFSENKGVAFILFSLLITPVEYILYKAATLHASSYHQFLTGRLVSDLFFFTLFFVLVTVFWYRKNPWPAIKSFLSSHSGIGFVAGTTATELLESWLIYKIPISLFTMLGTLSIPTAYFIGRKKYNERFDWRHALGAILIAAGIILFLIKNTSSIGGLN